MVSAALIRDQIETSLNSKAIRNTFGIPKPIRKPKEKPEDYTPVLSPPTKSESLPVPIVTPPIIRTIRNKKPQVGDLDLNDF